MKRFITTVVTIGFMGCGINAVAGPEEDRVAFNNYFTAKFSKTPVDDFINGIYSIDAPSREQWEEIEEFPPYEIDIEEGQTLFETAFANGNSYATCVENGSLKPRHEYPYFDATRSEVVTLELAINECRLANDEKPLKYGKGAIAKLSAYMAFQSRDEPINVVINDDPAALAAYENGKEFYYSKRGQLNFSCFDCHGSSAGMNVRADRLSPALGHPSHFPVYRSKWGGMGTLHRRFKGCNEQVRAKGFKPQSVVYRNLEYFLTYMSNGLAFNGPGARK